MKQLVRSPYFTVSWIVLVMVLLDVLAISDNYAYLNIRPNPYFLVAMMFSTLYGIRVALVSSVLVSVAFLLSVHFNLNYQVVETLFDFEYLSLPIITLIVSVVLGEIRQRSLDKLRAHKKAISDLEKSENYLQGNLQLREKENAELKKRLISRLDSVRSFYEIARSLYTVDEKALMQNFLEAIQRQFRVEEMAIYKLEASEGSLRLMTSTERGSFEADLKTEDLDALASEALKLRALTTIENVFSLESFESKKNQTILAVPLIAETEISHLILIRDMPFLEYIPSNFKIFRLYGEWLSKAIEYLRLYHHSLNNNIWNESLGIYRFRYFRDRISEEFHRSIAFDLPLTLLKVQITGLEGVSEEKSELIKKLICGILGQKISKLNYIVEGRTSQEFYGVFPVSKTNVVAPIARDIEAEILRLNLHSDQENILVRTELRELGPQMNSFQEFAEGFI